jgi:hypothetical protein
MGQRVMSTLTFTHKAVRETMPRELPRPPSSFTAWVLQCRYRALFRLRRFAIMLLQLAHQAIPQLGPLRDRHLSDRSDPSSGPTRTLV